MSDETTLHQFSSYLKSILQTFSQVQSFSELDEEERQIILKYLTDIGQKVKGE